MFSTKKIQSFHISTPQGELVLSAKAGEDPEIKPFSDEIEDSDDGLTNDGQMILNVVPSRTYIQNVFGYSDSDLPKIKAMIDLAKSSENAEVPANAVMTDGSIYSNTGVFVGPVTYDGSGTITFKFACAKDWITT